MRLLPDRPPSPAGTISDTLDEDTPYASPATTPRQPVPGIGSFRPGEQAPEQSGEATPGFTPPQSPHLDAALPWQDARPPSVQPGQRCSWLFVPLLHAGAGHLTRAAEQAWQEGPGFGTRFAELAAALRRAPGVPPATLLRLLRAAADCANVEVGTLAAEPDGLEPATAQLSALPSDAPLPVSAAVLVCTAPDGYLSAPAQSALLEAYGGGALAAAAQALADDACPCGRSKGTPSSWRKKVREEKKNNRTV